MSTLSSTIEDFQKSEVPTPRSNIFKFEDLDKNNVENAFKNYLSKNKVVVIKPDYGTRGETIKFPKNHEEAWQEIKKIQSGDDKGFVMQEFIQTSTNDKAQSNRILVVGGEAVLGLKITANGDSLIANTAQGSTSELMSYEELKKLGPIAEKAAKSLNLPICSGVDILQSTAGEFNVLEVNSGLNISGPVSRGAKWLPNKVAEAFLQKVQEHKLSKPGSAISHAASAAVQQQTPNQI